MVELGLTLALCRRVPDTLRSTSLLRWSLRAAAAVSAARWPCLSALSAAEVGVRVASPWALKAIVDHVFGERAAARVASQQCGGRRGATSTATRASRCFSRSSALGLAAHLAHQLIMLLHSRVSVGVSQRLTRDMREQLFGHLQRLALAHHTKTPAGDAVYRLTSDAAWLDQLALRAAMPAAVLARSRSP